MDLENRRGEVYHNTKDSFNMELKMVKENIVDWEIISIKECLKIINFQEMEQLFLLTDRYMMGNGRMESIMDMALISG